MIPITENGIVLWFFKSLKSGFPPNMSGFPYLGMTRPRDLMARKRRKMADLHNFFHAEAMGGRLPAAALPNTMRFFIEMPKRWGPSQAPFLLPLFLI